MTNTNNTTPDLFNITVAVLDALRNAGWQPLGFNPTVTEALIRLTRRNAADFDLAVAASRAVESMEEQDAEWLAI